MGSTSDPVQYPIAARVPRPVHFAGRICGLRLRLAEDGTVRVIGRAPHLLLAQLREHRASLAALLAGRACRRCGRAVADRGSDCWAPFANGTATHPAFEDTWELERLRARAEAALSGKALADEAELTFRGAGLL